MPLPQFARHTITVITPGVREVHGDEIDDWSEDAVTKRQITGCWVEPKTTEENNFRRDTVRAGFDVLIPIRQPDGTDTVPPVATDRIQHPLADGDFKVKGDIMSVPSSSGILDHMFCYVERWTSR